MIFIAIFAAFFSAFIATVFRFLIRSLGLKKRVVLGIWFSGLLLSAIAIKYLIQSPSEKPVGLRVCPESDL
jgi:hypothetical protein